MPTRSHMATERTSQIIHFYDSTQRSTFRISISPHDNSSNNNKHRLRCENSERTHQEPKALFNNEWNKIKKYFSLLARFRSFRRRTLQCSRFGSPEREDINLRRKFCFADTSHPIVIVRKKTLLPLKVRLAVFRQCQRSARKTVSHHYRNYFAFFFPLSQSFLEIFLTALLGSWLRNFFGGEALFVRSCQRGHWNRATWNIGKSELRLQVSSCLNDCVISNEKQLKFSRCSKPRRRA